MNGHHKYRENAASFSKFDL